MDTKQNRLGVALIALFMSVSSISIAQSITSKADSLSYSTGVMFAKQMKAQGITDLDSKIVTKAIMDHMAGQNIISEKESGEYMMNYINQKKEERMAKAKEQGEQFLAENAKKPGIKITDSGLQYEVISGGLGDAHPTLSSTVETHYHGMLVDGTVFDSSVDRGQTISFPLGNVIKGWQEGLQLMKKGDKYRFFIPSELAYGSKGAGGLIPPHSALIFEVELVDIK